MAHTHSHAHGHHHHEPASYGRAFAIGVALNVLFVGIEAVYGTLAGSLALVADAGHNASDVLGLLLAWGALVLARRQPTVRRTYGLRRVSILAALANGLVLLVAIGGIAWEALQRFTDPAPVASSTIIVVAAVGVVVNGITAMLFMAGRSDDVNIRGAFLHMAADALVSLGVVLAGFGMLLSGWQWLDPLASLLVVLVVFISTWGLLRDSMNLALDAVPDAIDMGQVERYLAGLPTVSEVHDLHVWPMSTTETALTAHLVVDATPKDNALISRACRELHDSFGIEHATLQIELHDPVHACELAVPGSL